MSQPAHETLPPVPGPEAGDEPLLTRATVVGLATAVLSLLVAFNVNLTTAQTAAILAVVGVLAPFAVAAWGRSAVFAPRTVRKMVAAAKRGDL